MKIPEHERFMRHVDQGGPEIAGHPELGRCWLWTGATNKNGHGVFMLEGGKLIAAHRYLFQRQWGPTRQKLWQVCKVPACVSPQHQRVGPPWEQVQEMRRKAKEAQAAKDTQNNYRRKAREEQSERGANWGHSGGLNYREMVPEVAKRIQGNERMRQWRALHNPHLAEPPDPAPAPDPAPNKPPGEIMRGGMSPEKAIAWARRKIHANPHTQEIARKYGLLHE